MLKILLFFINGHIYNIYIYIYIYIAWFLFDNIVKIQITIITLQSSIILQQFFLLFLDIDECLSGLFQYIALFLFLFLDIDECLSSSTNNCPANSSCTNTDGSYTCTCLSGFRKVGSLCRGTQFLSSVDSQFFMFVCQRVFNATFNNISVISWRSVLLVEQTGGPGENHRSVVSQLFISL